MGYLMLAAAAIQAVGAIVKSQGEASTANAQSQIARNAAITQRQNADYATAVGDQQADIQGLKNRDLLGTQKATQAASGIDVNMGSAVDVRSSTSKLGMLDALTIRSNAARQAYGHELEAANETAQSKLYRAKAKSATWSGIISAGGSLLSGAAGYANAYGNPFGAGGASKGVVSDFGDRATFANDVA